ncbi:hypothetical protein T4D_9204 [Trichinella pseudospiralis]|uniref:Uncharacterized protein n=1 Tax=Trichinella pseudospiralis TaxID=6337 RepID=A0A0V1DMJ6_TRIPS|nr:hypothetical protein T4D_9204 [Trichinella pseudospiralis]
MPARTQAVICWPDTTIYKVSSRTAGLYRETLS